MTETGVRSNGFIIVFCLLGNPCCHLPGGLPVFNNVDEIMHYDLVMKYSTGHVPVGLELFGLGALHGRFQLGRICTAVIPKHRKRFKPFYLSDTK